MKRENPGIHRRPPRMRGRSASQTPGSCPFESPFLPPICDERARDGSGRVAILRRRFGHDRRRPTLAWLRMTSLPAYALSVLLALLAATIAVDAAPAVPTAAADQKACDGHDAEAVSGVGERAAIAKDAAAAARAYRRACDGEVGLLRLPRAELRGGSQKEGGAAVDIGGHLRACLRCSRRQELLLQRHRFRTRHRRQEGCRQGVRRLPQVLRARAPGGLHQPRRHAPDGQGHQDTVRAAAVYAGACRDGDGYACYWLGRITPTSSTSPATSRTS